MKVLIIEDNTGIQNALMQGFKTKNIIAESASDGKEGLRKLRNTSYNVVIIDLLLPKLSGEKVIEKMREEEINIPILVLTAVRDIKTKTRLLSLGADDYIEKPFSFDEVCARISAILRRGISYRKKTTIKMDDLEIIPEKRIAIRGKRKIVLRPKEYALLDYLLQHPEVVISRQTLMDQVWGYCTSTLSNTVDSHISALRRKIDQKGEKKLIKTIHGMGYMISVD